MVDNHLRGQNFNEVLVWLVPRVLTHLFSISLLIQRHLGDDVPVTVSKFLIDSQTLTDRPFYFYCR